MSEGAFPSDLGAIVHNLSVRLGRSPTDAEVYTFVFGSEIERKLVWNKKTKENQ